MADDTNPQTDDGLENSHLIGGLSQSSLKALSLIANRVRLEPHAVLAVVRAAEAVAGTAEACLNSVVRKDSGITTFKELLDKGVPSVHFYIMQSSKAIKMLMSKLRL